MSLSYTQAIELVSSLEGRGWRLGLDRMQELVKRSRIEHWPKFVHIAGTNGKGSVTAYAQSLLQKQGWKTGAYFSPYVFTVRERIQFLDPASGRTSALISEDEFAHLVEQLWPVADSMAESEFGGPTEFEFKTLMGFQHWSDNRADYVALEVGLGGRLDATNVVRPVVSVVTNIGLDHTEILGNSLGQIAVEKAGIIKPGIPVVVGDVGEEAWLAIETIAKVNQAPVLRYGRDFYVSTGFDGFRVTTPNGSYERLNPGITGACQPHNMAVAIAAVEAAGAIKDPRLVSHGVARASAPGRMQSVTWQGQRMLLDGAHNAEAAANLVATLATQRDRYGKMVLLAGMLHGHAAAAFFEPLSKLVDEVHFVPIDFHRTRLPDELLSEAGWLFERSQAHRSVEEGMLACMASGADTVLVTGSFYLVGEVGRLIGV